MALLYHSKKTVTKTESLVITVQDLDYQGLGVAKINGKTWFVENALPNEKVKAVILDEKRQYGLARAVKILQKSSDRVEPQCQFYQQCGGCQTLHIAINLQRQAKQKALFSRLAKLQVKPIEFMPMIIDDDVHYRRKVRLSIQYHNRKLNIGFRQKNSKTVIPINYCVVLEEQLNHILPKLTTLFSNWSTPKTLGHIELVKADNGVAMLLRHLGKLTEINRTLLLDLAKSENLTLFVQDDDNIQHLYGSLPYYQLKKDLRLQFDIRDFIQINDALNQRMVETAINWLELKNTDNVLDLFCGMGNFTLPISQLVKNTVGIEGVFAMVEKATNNALLNHCNNVRFYRADLDQPFTSQAWATQHFNKVLLDPPRNGAAFALNALCSLNPEKVLYISCNPATLVRDAEILLKFGYHLSKVAMIDMFPHTAHLESISLFEKE